MMDNLQGKEFTFEAHKHKVSGPQLNNDYTVTLSVDEAEQLNLSPFLLIKPDTRLKVVVTIEDE